MNDNTISKIVVKNVLKICEERNILIKDLENIGGISRGYLSRINKGQFKHISIDTVQRWSKYLEVPLSSLVDPKFYYISHKQKLEAEIREIDKKIKEEEKDEILKEYYKASKEIDDLITLCSYRNYV